VAISEAPPAVVSEAAPAAELDITGVIEVDEMQVGNEQRTWNLFRYDVYNIGYNTNIYNYMTYI
jgi:hypothetical protein